MLLCVIVFELYYCEGFIIFSYLRALQVVSELFPGQSGFFFWVCRKFEEKYWVATFSATFENLGVESVENN